MNENKGFCILNLEPKGYSPKARFILESLGRVDDGPLDRPTLLDRIRDYDMLIVRLGHQIDSEVIQAAPRLKVIVSATTGLNHIDTKLAQARGIKLFSLMGEREFLDTVHATAEHTWALLLALIRRLPQAHAHVLAGGWDREMFRGHELHGRTLGIVGLGRLGTKVARYGLAFGMRVIGCDSKEFVNMPDGVVRLDLERVVAESDVVSLHVNYTPENHAMMGHKQFAGMKQGALFINTSRGELVVEQALLNTLASGHLGGAALDVLCGEYAGWDISRPLLDYARTSSNLIITPHVGGCTRDSMEKTEVFMARKLRDYFRGEE